MLNVFVHKLDVYTQILYSYRGYPHSAALLPAFKPQDV